MYRIGMYTGMYVCVHAWAELFICIYFKFYLKNPFTHFKIVMKLLNLVFSLFVITNLKPFFHRYDIAVSCI